MNIVTEIFISWNNFIRCEETSSYNIIIIAQDTLALSQLRICRHPPPACKEGGVKESAYKESENFFIIFPILYNTLPIIHKSRIKTEGGCLHILNWDRANISISILRLVSRVCQIFTSVSIILITKPTFKLVHL